MPNKPGSGGGQRCSCSGTLDGPQPKRPSDGLRFSGIVSCSDMPSSLGGGAAEPKSVPDGVEKQPKWVWTSMQYRRYRLDKNHPGVNLV